CQHSDGTPYSF
nr:immunoglobulin light chain junction region [Macaca mulatta]